MVLLPTNRMDSLFSPRCVWKTGPFIVGAGPLGLAEAASLREQGVPFVVLEREDYIASPWQKRAYNRLKLHLPKQYAAKFDIKPEFRSTVQSARYDETSGLWHVRVAAADGAEMEYIGHWLVVAIGENADNVVPDIPGLADFGGEVTHVSEYKFGKDYSGKLVLVVDCGNSGMEISLDLCEYAAQPCIVVCDAMVMPPRCFVVCDAMVMPPRCVRMSGIIIVGAGLLGLAVAASLREQRVPFVVLEREDCIASLWQKRTYNRLKLHLPEQFCQLPRMPFPESYPEYPTRLRFIDYLEKYVAKFNIKPEFRSTVQSACYDEKSGLWRVRVAAADGAEMEYIGHYVVRPDSQRLKLT